MQISVSKITIARDPMTIVSKMTWPWEVAVLQEKYGGKLEVYGEAIEERDEVPNAASEYQRMGANHGFEGDRGVAYVEMVYGRGAAGIAALDKEIQKATGKKAVSKSKAKADKADKADSVKTKAAPAKPDADKDEPDDPLG